MMRTGLSALPRPRPLRSFGQLFGPQPARSMCFVAQIGCASNVRRPAPNCGVKRPAPKSQKIRAEQHIVHIHHLDESPVAHEELSMKPRPATLVLGGGGARGVAHLGAI